MHAGSWPGLRWTWSSSTFSFAAARTASNSSRRRSLPVRAALGRSLMRVHRNWLVNLDFAKALEREDGETSLFVGPSLGDESQGLHIPVSRDRAAEVRATLLANATGLRHA